MCWINNANITYLHNVYVSAPPPHQLSAKDYAVKRAVNWTWKYDKSLQYSVLSQTYITCRYTDSELMHLSVSIVFLSADIRLISKHGRPHLLTEHWLFHERAPVSGTEVSLLRDRACGTLCRLRYDRWPATDSLGDIWKHIYLEPRNNGALWRFFLFFLRYTNTVTYLLTSVDCSMLISDCCYDKL